MRFPVSRPLVSMALALVLTACGGGGDDAGTAAIPTGTVVLSEGTLASHNGSFVGEARSATSVSVNGSIYTVTIENASVSTSRATVIYDTNGSGSLVAVGIDLDTTSNGNNYYCHNVDGPACPAGVTLDATNQIVRFNNALILEEQGGGRSIKFNGSLAWQLPV